MDILLANTDNGALLLFNSVLSYTDSTITFDVFVSDRIIKH